MDIYQSFTFSADTWYHVAVVRNGNDLLYSKMELRVLLLMLLGYFP